MGTRHRKIRKLRGSRSHGWGQVKGHRSHRTIIKKWINVGDLDGLFLHSKGTDPIDLDKLGYEKLLGSGSVKGSYELLINSFTKQAQSKIEKAGGKISSRS